MYIYIYILHTIIYFMCCITLETPLLNGRTMLFRPFFLFCLVLDPRWRVDSHQLLIPFGKHTKHDGKIHHF